MTELSPAAEAVLDASFLGLHNTPHKRIAAALRALATFAEPVEILTGPGMAEFDEVIRASDILTIAAELDS